MSTLQHVFEKYFSDWSISVVAPASGTNPEKLDNLKKRTGVSCHFPDNMMVKTAPYHAQTDTQRLAQLKAALYDEQHNNTLIWTFRGGYGSARLIDDLMKSPPPKTEKVFIGFSDVTALHLFFSQHWGWHTIHGAGLLQLLDEKLDPLNFEKIASLLRQTEKGPSLSGLIPMNPVAEKIDNINAMLTGGNLTLVESSLGTPWQIVARDRIVFLEEIGERGYRVDRSLHHLTQAGIFSDAKAVILGDFSTKELDDTIDFALQRFADTTSLPVYRTDCIGHRQKNYPLRYNTPYGLSYNPSMGQSELTLLA